VPIRFKPGHSDPSKDKLNVKGFDPKAHGWDPKGDLANEFRRCRKRSTAPPTDRFLFPETTAQENGWCMKPQKPPRESALKLPRTDSKVSLLKEGKDDSELPQRRSRRRELKEGQDGVASQDGSGSKLGLGKWASESQLSAASPILAVGSQLSAVAPSYVSSAIMTELSRQSSWPGVATDLVTRSREQEARIADCMTEYRRYMCYGDRGNKHFRPLGETDATAYASAFMKATSGVPPHKIDPRKADPKS
jgi:hypothetical protein